jgi:hypothetical protein
VNQLCMSHVKAEWYRGGAGMERCGGTGYLIQSSLFVSRLQERPL